MVPNPHIPILSRRDFMRVGGVGVAGYSLLPMLMPLNVQARDKVEPRGSAEICIFIMLQGAASQMDTFDVKEGPETPGDFDIRTVRDGLQMPVGTLPMLSERFKKYTIIRSMAAWDKNHDRGTYHLQSGREFQVARAGEVPSIGSVIAYEFKDKRRESDILPPFISFDVQTTVLVNCGFLPPSTAPMNLKRGTPLSFVMSEEGKRTFERRQQLARTLHKEWHETADSRSRIFRDLDDYRQSATLLSDPRCAAAFTLSDEDKERYGDSSSGFGYLGSACAMARNIVEADLGTKFVLINHGSWDLHSDIYKKDTHWSQYTMNDQLDKGLARLLDDLESRTDKDGRRLIDKTLVACVGEFGRTPGVLNPLNGRDHHIDAGIAVFAGAGVKGDRVLGATDELGGRIIDPGWHKNRPIYPEDVLATIYSAMGIDWTKKITQTPSGRAFEYTEYISPKGLMDFGEISELFA
jgi:hypothetical protein